MEKIEIGPKEVARLMELLEDETTLDEWIREKEIGDEKKVEEEKPC